jgi:hypothetical protein
MLAKTKRRLGGWPVLAACAAMAVGAGPAAHGVVISYFANLDGPSESPPVPSPGVGFAQIDIDTVAHTMHIGVSFSGLLGNVTVAHIHSETAAPFTGTAPVATQVPTFPGFPSGVTSGTYEATFDMSLASSYNPSYIASHGGTPASAEAALFASFAAGTAYLNIHSSMFPSGEIRGFLMVPGPATASLLMLGAALGSRRRRRIG